MIKLLKTSNKGFSLVEMMIALAISGIIISGVYAAFQSQQTSYVVQEQIVEIQQNARFSLDILTNDLRMAGFDPLHTGNFTITSIRSRDLNGVADVNGNPALEMTIDFNSNGIVDANETVSYSLFEFPAMTPAERDGIVDLAREVGAGGRQLLAESIVAIGFAYSYTNASGNIVTNGGNPVWAVDTDNDNFLDTSIDTNADGVIDTTDAAAGVVLATPISPDNIVAAKIWLLAQSRARDNAYQENTTYVVANQRISPGADGDVTNDHCRHRVVEMTVKCRNMGL